MKYALPTGQIVALHDHCTAAAERYQLADGSFVMAVRVDYPENGSEDERDRAEIAAWKLAKQTAG